jgi:hypothetical protein
MKWRVSLLLIGLLLLVITIGAQTVNAETVQQMRARVAAELIAKQSVAVAACDATCLANWQAGGAWLVPLAGRIGLPVDTVVKANLAYTIQWGYDFERQFKRPPTIDDWVYGWADRNEQFRAFFDVSPVLYRVNRWAELKDAQLKKEYGGAW